MWKGVRLMVCSRYSGVLWEGGILPFLGGYEVYPSEGNGEIAGEFQVLVSQAASSTNRFARDYNADLCS